MYAFGRWTVFGGILMASLLQSSAQEPGMRIRISQRGLNFLRDIGVPILEQGIKTLTIPNQRGSWSTIVGPIDYDVTSIRITSFGIPSTSLTPSPAARGLTLRTSRVYFNLHGNWRWRTRGFFPISDYGSFDASASGISLTLTLRIGVDSRGRPTASSTSRDCSFHVSRMNIRLHGGASWLYNLFDVMIADAFKNSINSQVCREILHEVNTDLRGKMRTIQVTAPVGNVAGIDYSLTERPTFSGSVNTAHKGEVYQTGRRTECPLPVPRIPTDTDTSRMIFIWITDFLPNSAGYVLQNIGYLQYDVTPDNVPAEYRNALPLDPLISQINFLNPNMEMQINMNSTKAPVLKAAPGGIQAVMVLDVSPYAILPDMPDKTRAYPFTLNVTLTANVTFNFNKNNITWSFSSFSSRISSVRSDFGFVFDITPDFQTKTNQMIETNLIPALNQKGAVGVPLPQLEGFNFLNPVITQGQGFLKIGADLSYTP